MIITGDLDGSEHAETVSFGFDGATCGIDLGKKNRSRLRRVLAPFIEAGRRAPCSSRGRGASRPGGSPADRSAVRAWAGAAGLKVSERGRISAGVMRQYDAACKAGAYVILVAPGEGCGLRGRRVRGLAGWVLLVSGGRVGWARRAVRRRGAGRVCGW